MLFQHNFSELRRSGKKNVFLSAKPQCCRDQEVNQYHPYRITKERKTKFHSLSEVIDWSRQTKNANQPVPGFA